MQYLKVPQEQQPIYYSETAIIFSKAIIALTRIVLYILSIHYNGFTISLYINLTVAVALFVLVEFAIWYRRFGFAGPQEEFSLPLTIISHLYGQVNIILLALSVNLQDHQPREMFFQIFMGQMVNYMLTLVVLHELLSIYLVKNSQDLINIFQPVQKSMIYLFLAYSTGTFFDSIAFAQTALIELYIFAGIAVLYLAVKSIMFDNLKNRVKKLFAQ